MPTQDHIDRQYLQQAIDIALKNASTLNGGPYGALIVKQNNIIASSGNFVTANLDPTAHAEIMAIRQACQVTNHFHLDDCTLYTSCEPCPMCLGAIYWARLSNVVFACNRHDAAAAGFDDSVIYAEINLAPEKRAITMKHLVLPNADAPFLAWNALPNKKCY